MTHQQQVVPFVCGLAARRHLGEALDAEEVVAPVARVVLAALAEEALLLGQSLHPRLDLHLHGGALHAERRDEGWRER